jgi:ribonuclease Z
VEVATDYMVFNVTKDDVRVRMAMIDESVWPLPSTTKKLDADPSRRVGFSPYIIGGREVFKDVVKQYYEETNKQYGTKFEPPK